MVNAMYASPNMTKLIYIKQDALTNKPESDCFPATIQRLCTDSGVTCFSPVGSDPVTHFISMRCVARRWATAVREAERPSKASRPHGNHPHCHRHHPKVFHNRDGAHGQLEDCTETGALNAALAGHGLYHADC